MTGPLLNGHSIPMENLRFRDVKILGSYSTGAMRSSAHETFVSEQFRQYAIEFATSVLARRQIGDKQELSVRHPATWWQHFKFSHLPGWWTRRWPVRWHTTSATVNFTRYDTYPSADVPLPQDFGRPVQYDTIVWDNLDFGTDPACTVFKLDGEVSPGRKWVSRKNLETALTTRIWLELTGYPDDRPPPPGVVVRATLDALEAYGVDLGGLVQQQALDQNR